MNLKMTSMTNRRITYSIFKEVLHKIKLAQCEYLPSRNLSSEKQPFDYRKQKYRIVKTAQLSRLRVVPDHINAPEYSLYGFPYEPPKTIDIKTEDEIKAIKKACQLAREVLDYTASLVKPDITTDELDEAAHNKCIELNAYPSPFMYKRFPKSICTSVNNVIIHGIPDLRKLFDGDIINIDVSVFYEGFHGDCSETYLVGKEVDEAGKKLVDVARRCRDAGIAVCADGVPFKAIGKAIEDLAESEGFSVYPNIIGHGIGRYFHGPPDIIHVENDFLGTMYEGMTFTIEPVISEGGIEMSTMEDGWTLMSVDGSRSAQFEHTILIQKNDAVILT